MVARSFGLSGVQDCSRCGVYYMLAKAAEALLYVAGNKLTAGKEERVLLHLQFF